MATPAEEISRQHEEARSLLAASMSCAVPISHGEISLTMKTRPTQDIFGKPKDDDDTESEEKKMLEETEEQQQRELPDITPWSSRGHVDVSKLHALVREGYRIAEHTPSPPPVAATSAATAKTKNGSKKATTSKTSSSKQSSPPKMTRATQAYTPDQIVSTTNLWDPINASIHNVNIVRPSHDAWGIGKIVLVFADDFLNSVYELPWWHIRTDIQEAIQPILECLQVPPQRIVRLLLASLPPGTTIPLHHDSGAWVWQTHRVHVPVVVEHPDDILFRVGKTDDCLERIDCSPGHVFEMNNQCRHAVSNCSEDYRVHLILDYADEPNSNTSNNNTIHKIHNHILLNPGERLLQTRRSVDRLVDKGRRPTPSFLILGAQKAGTTSLYEYMMQHPLIVRPKRRETHCLDWRWKEALQPNDTFTDEQLRQHCHMFYEEAALKLHPSCCTGDSTPSYLLDSRRVIANLKRVFPWRIQFLVTTRDPIQRAESHFAMVTSPHGTPAQLKTRGAEWRNKSFQEVVEQEIKYMQDCGLIPYWNIADGRCDQAIFEAFSNTPEEDEAWNTYLARHVALNTGSYGLLARGLYALNLRPWLQAFDKDQFLVLELATDLASDRVRSTMERVFDHVGVPSSFELPDVSPQNTRDYEPKMDADVYQYLQRFFAPHNQRFQDLLATLP